jgi:hypothetical protein
LVSLLARDPHLLDPAVSYAVQQQGARGFFIFCFQLYFFRTIAPWEINSLP